MLFSILIFLCLYLPFQVALNPAAGIDLASVRILSLFIFFAWLAKGLKDGKINIKNNIFTGLIIIFIFLNVLSFFYATNPVWAGRKIIFLLSLFPLFFVVSDIARGNAKIEKILKTLVISGAIVSAIGILQFFAQFLFSIGNVFEFWAEHVIPPFLGNNLTQAVLQYPSWLVNISGSTFFRATSIFPDPHMFSLYLGLLLPVSIGLWVSFKSRAWLVAAGLIFIADILTFSRGGYIGIVGGLFFASMFLASRFSRRLKLTFGVLLVMLFAVIIIPSPISARFADIFDFSEGSNAGRIAMWKSAVDLIAERPFFGVGIGNFSQAISPMSDYREPIYAHNTYLDISAEAGLLAGLAWASMIVMAVYSCIRRNNGILFFGLAAGIVVFSLHAMVETGIYSPTVLTLLIIYLGLINAKIDEKPVQA